MTQIIVEQTVGAPANEVWAMVTDLEASVQILASVTGLEITSNGEDFGLGTAWTETRLMNGKASTEEFHVVQYEESSHYVAASSSGPIGFESTVRVEERSAGVALSISMQTRPNGVVAKLFDALAGPLLKRMIVKTMQADLDDFVAALDR